MPEPHPVPACRATRMTGHRGTRHPAARAAQANQMTTTRALFETNASLTDELSQPAASLVDLAGLVDRVTAHAARAIFSSGVQWKWNENDLNSHEPPNLQNLVRRNRAYSHFLARQMPRVPTVSLAPTDEKREKALRNYIVGDPNHTRFRSPPLQRALITLERLVDAASGRMPLVQAMRRVQAMRLVAAETAAMLAALHVRPPATTTPFDIYPAPGSANRDADTQNPDMNAA